MIRRIAVSLVALALAGSFLAASTAEASESPHFDWIGFLGKTLNAVILFGGLFLLVRKPLVQFLSQHGFYIKKDIEEREEKISLHTGELESINRRLVRIEQELEAMKQAAETNGRQEMDRLCHLGQEETAKILSRTEGEINLRIESAVKKLKGRIAELTIAHFSEGIRKSLDDRAHRKMIERGIEGVKQLDERK